jgi:hypothetical protein
VAYTEEPHHDGRPPRRPLWLGTVFRKERGRDARFARIEDRLAALETGLGRPHDDLDTPLRVESSCELGRSAPAFDVVRRARDGADALAEVAALRSANSELERRCAASERDLEWMRRQLEDKNADLVRLRAQEPQKADVAWLRTERERLARELADERQHGRELAGDRDRARHELEIERSTARYADRLLRLLIVVLVLLALPHLVPEDLGELLRLLAGAGR